MVKRFLARKWRPDPGLATGPDGTFYLVSLWNPLSGMAVLRGRVNDTGTGITWSNPTVIQTGGENYDKENIAVDPNTGTIYITYTRFGAQSGTIGLYVSNDGGLTFQGPFSVARVAGHTLQGSVPAVGPNGELYVAYDMDYPSDCGSVRFRHIPSTPDALGNRRPACLPRSTGRSGLPHRHLFLS